MSLPFSDTMEDIRFYRIKRFCCSGFERYRIQGDGVTKKTTQVDRNDHFKTAESDCCDDPHVRIVTFPPLYRLNGSILTAQDLYSGVPVIGSRTPEVRILVRVSW